MVVVRSVRMLTLHGRRQRGLQLRQKFFDAIDDGDDVRARLALNIQNDRRSFVGPRRLPNVFRAVDDGGHIGEPDGRAIAIRDDDGAVAVAGKQLVVGADGVGLMRAVERAFGLVDVGLAQCGAQIFQAQPIRSQRGGIGLHAHRGTLSAADADQPNAGKLRNFLRQRGVGEVFDFGERQRIGSHRQRQDRRVGGIDLAVNRRIRQALRQKIGSAVDGRLHFLLGDIDVQVETELQGDDRAAKGARRSHLVQAGDFAELALEWSSDRRGHYVRTGAGIKRLHLNCRVIDLRKR